MDEVKKTLVKAGFPSKNVAIRARKKRTDIAKDVLKEATKGKYDTVVVGKRGLSGFHKLLSGSVSKKVFGTRKAYLSL